MSIVIPHALIRFTFAFGIALTSVVIAAAQESNPTSDPKNTPNANFAGLWEQLRLCRTGNGRGNG